MIETQTPETTPPGGPDPPPPATPATRRRQPSYREALAELRAALEARDADPPSPGALARVRAARVRLREIEEGRITP